MRYWRRLLPNSGLDLWYVHSGVSVLLGDVLKVRVERISKM